MTYIPQPGTVPYRAIAWLRSMKRAQPGANLEPSTQQLCEALEIESNGFVTCMAKAVCAGLVSHRTKRGYGKGFYWSLGRGVPVVQEPEEEDDAPPKRSGARVIVRPGPLFPGVYAEARKPDEMFSTLEWDGHLLVAGMEVRDGVAIFTPEMVRAIKQRADWLAA